MSHLAMILGAPAADAQVDDADFVVWRGSFGAAVSTERVQLAVQKPSTTAGLEARIRER